MIFYDRSMHGRFAILQPFFFTVIITLISCSGRPSSQPVTEQHIDDHIASAYTWTKLADHGPWEKSYNFQMMSLRDTLWVFHPDGNWYSADGINWMRSLLPNAINNLAFLDYVEFDGAIYGLGYFNGNIERYTQTSVITRTTDMRSWETIANASELPQRFFYHPFVFQNKIWIIGGEDSDEQFSDIWNSPDGVHWKKEKEDLPFGKRSNSQVVELNGKLFLLNNDVWSSTDALNWELVTEEIVPGEMIFGYAALVFDNRIWLLGCNRNGQFSSELLSSADGKTWVYEEAQWTPRGGIAATVHRNKIYMTGGKYGGTPDAPEFIYSNDVWMMERK